MSRARLIHGAPAAQGVTPFCVVAIAALFAASVLAAGLWPSGIALAAGPAAAPSGTGPSAHCHSTDGAFTTCPDGTQEWSDVPPINFSETQTFLYVDQARLNPTQGSPQLVADTLMLMYDECGRTRPLGRDEYVLVSFKTVEVIAGREKLVNYVLHLFTDGTIIFIEDGVPNPAGRAREIEGQRGAVGFGRSPSCSFDHVTAEFQITLDVAGGHGYSPDPLFWSSTPPEPERCRVAGLTPITDPLAQEFENGRSLDLDHVDQALVASANRFITRLQNELGITTTFTSGFRPTAYQAHLYELRQRKQALQHLTPAQQDACSSLAQQVDAEIARHGLATDPHTGLPKVNPPGRSQHEFGRAVDIDRGLRTTNQQAAVDNLAEQEGIHRPCGLGDPVHFSAAGVGCQATLNTAVHSPIDILLTDPRGRRIGFDPATRTVVNEIGEPQASYSGVGTDPQIITIGGAEPGAYLVSGLGSGNGAYTIDLFTDDDDASDLASQTIAGTATVGHFIAPVSLQLSDNGGFTTAVLPVPTVPPGRVTRPGFNANVFPGNDDGSIGPVPLGLTARFFGNTFTSVFINNNGNLTFDASLSTFTPFNLNTTRRSIIAPFFADVDTRVGNTVTFGPGVVNGRPAFGVNWPGVGCFSRITSVLNFFQVLLVDRQDRAPEDFDIEFNYDSIQWDTGQASGGNFICQGGAAARVGFSNGTGVPGTFFELPGSGIPGAFFDSNTATGLIHSQRNSDALGRYLFEVRNGVAVVAQDRDGDGIPDDLDNCPNTPNHDQRDSGLTGIGDACRTTRPQHATAAFLQARSDGSVATDRQPVAVGNEPRLADQLARIVNFRVAAGLTGSAAALATNLVDSAVATGLVSRQDASQLISAVLQLTDTTPPTTTAATAPRPNAAGWNNSDLTITLTAQDNSGGSGVATTHFGVDAPACTPTALDRCSGYSAPFAIRSEGTHTVVFFSKDNAGNVETPHQLTVRIDKTGPLVTGTRRTPANAAGWNNGPVLVRFDAHDDLSGFAGGSHDAFVEVTVSTEGDNQSVTRDFTDLADNTASATVSGLRIDTHAPITTATPSPAANANGWNRSAVSVTLTATDNLSGVARTEVSLDGAPFAPYRSAIAIDTEGIHTLRFRSTDKADNVEAIRELLVRIDLTPPEATISFDPTAGDLVVIGRDALSGVALSGPLPPGVVIFDQDGSEQRSYHIADRAGNTLDLTIDVKQTGQQLKAEIVSLQYNGGTLITAQASTLHFEWALSGTALKELEQKIGIGKDQQRQEAKAKFEAKKNETVIEIKDGTERKLTRPGLVLLRVETDRGALAIRFE